MDDIKAKALRTLLLPADLLLRRFVFNTSPPPVAQLFKEIQYGTDVEQRMDIIVPHGEPPFPVLLYFHGGGWISGDKGSYERICRSLATNGFLTCNVNYRLAPRHRFPAQVQDVASAVAWMCRHALRYGGDGSKVILAGDSAGAHLASWYATCLCDDSLRDAARIEAPLLPRQHLKGILLFYGIYDLDKALARKFPFIRLYVQSLLGARNQAYAQRAGLASPARHVCRDLPPVFLCAGEKDGLFPESIAYAQRLKDQGVDISTLFFRRHEHAEAFHGFLYLHGNACSQLALDEAGKFLRRCCEKARKSRHLTSSK